MDGAGQPTVQELLRHAEFVRSLGAALLREGEEVDDVVQDVMVSALRRPPQDHERSRGWFAKVARNAVFQRRRETEARRRREAGASAGEATMSAADLVARQEILDRIATAVRELPEAQRAVVLLRFYEALPTARVAERLGVPLDTARSRLKRALELLRGELDRATTKGRDEWAPAVALLIGTSGRGAAIGKGGLLLGFAAALLVAGGATIGVVEWKKARASRNAVEAATAPIVAPPGTRALPVAAAPAATRQEQAAPKSAPVVPDLRIRGRALDGSGRPVAGAHAVLKLVDPASATPAGKGDALADGAGGFEIAMPLRRSLDWELTVATAGTTTVRREGKAIQPGEQLALGDLVIEPTGAVELRVVAPDGKTVRLQGDVEMRRPAPTDVVAVEQHFVQDAAHDRFVVDGAPPGDCEVRITIEGRPRGVLHAAVAVRSGATVTKELVYAGPDPATCICIHLPDVAGLDPETMVRVEDADGRRVAATLVKDGEEGPTYLIATPAPSTTCAVIAKVPGFERYRKDGLHCGNRLAIRLRAPSGFTLRAVGTQASGFPADTVFFWESDGDYLMSRHVLGDGDVAPDGTIHFSDPPPDSDRSGAGVADAPMSLVVSIPSRPVIQVPLAGGTIAVGATLDVPCGARDEGSKLRGEVFGPDGSPAVGCEVQLFSPAALGDGPESPRKELPLPGSHSSVGGGLPSQARARLRRAIARTRTADGGRFEFVEVPDGHWVVQVVDAAFPDAPDAVVDVARTGAGDANPPRLVTLKASGGATIVGRLVGPAGASFAGLSVEVEYDPKQAIARMRRGVEQMPVAVAADGSFRIGGLEAGHVTLKLTADALTHHEDDHASVIAFSPGGVEPGEMALVEFDVPSSGTVARDFPAQALVPAFLNATVRVDGAVDGTLKIGVLPVGASNGIGTTWLSDASGTVRIGALLPGRYVVTVGPADASWLYVSPRPLELRAGEAVPESLDLELATATVRVFIRDAATPAKSWTFQVASPIPGIGDDAALFLFGVSIHTDAEGLATLRWPRGDLLLGVEPGDGSPPLTKLAWPPKEDRIDVRLR